MDVVGIVASLVISVLALLVSVLSARYSRAQAVAAEAAARMEAARRHEESKPVLSAEIEPVNDGGWHRLVLTLDGPRPLDQLDVEIVEGLGATFTSGQFGVAPMGAEPLRASYPRDEPLRPGDRHRWQIEFDREKTDGEDLRLRVHCVGTDDAGAPANWDVVIPATGVPYDLSRSAY